MTDWGKVDGDVCPLDIDTECSETTVYEHRNAVEVETEQDGVKYKYWEYEERTFTKEEYAAMLSGVRMEKEEGGGKWKVQR